MGWYVLLLALALAASLLVVRQLLLADLASGIQADLVQEAEELRTLAAGSDPADGEPFGDRVDRVFDVFLRRNVPAPFETIVTFLDGEPYLRSIDDPPVRLDEQDRLVEQWGTVEEPDRGRTTVAGVGQVDYLAVPLSHDGTVRGVFVVAAFTDLARGPIDQVVRTSGLVGLGALGLGLVLAWSVSSRVLAPVRALTDTARSITETDLGRRIEVPGDDEIGRLAMTMNAMLDRLEAAFVTQRLFIDDAGHELRTPITIVRGHLELLEDDPAERAETIGLVLDELDRMARMVDDLLLLAKAQRPDFLNPGRIHVAELTRAVHAKAQAIAPRTWELDTDGAGEIVADGQRLTQALVQLAHNATRHTGEGATVTIGGQCEGATARFWVADDGPGIAADEQERILERFARGRDTPRGSEGAGLGLAIVKAIAEAHGGRLELDSAPGRGATFTVVVPAGTGESGEEPA